MIDKSLLDMEATGPNASGEEPVNISEPGLPRTTGDF